MIAAIVTALTDSAAVSAVVTAKQTQAGGSLLVEQAVHVEERSLVETIDATSVKEKLKLAIEQMGGEDDLVPDTVDLPPIDIRGIIESLLFVSPKPLSMERLMKLMPGAQANYLEGFLRGLAKRYDRERRGWSLKNIGGGWQLLTREDFHSWARQLDRKELPTKLTKGAMETLAIVAYKQPVSRGAIEDVRGVQSGPMLRQLMDMKLVTVVGRQEGVLGNPMLYGTTDTFLQRFGLEDTDDLPRTEEFGL